MGIFQSDMAIKTAIELSIEDMRKNPWLLDDILSDCINNPYLKDKYGQKQIDSMKEWFQNNQIDIYMSERNDKNNFPCITITLGSSNEKDDMKHMADLSTETVTLYPQNIKKPIPFIVKPFAFTSYDPSTGILTVDDTLPGMDRVFPSMLVVNPDNGNAYIIQDIIPGGLVLEPNLSITATRLAIVPKFQYYTARREHTFFQESYSVKCYSHGDPQVLLWLWSITLYSILRYRESMLEAQGFSQVLVSNSEMSISQEFSSEGGEIVWMRTISLSGMTENSWIKTPRRHIESVGLIEKTPKPVIDPVVLPGIIPGLTPAPSVPPVVVPENTPKGYRGGLQILSNNEPDTVEQELQESWFPIDESNSEQQ